MKLKEINTKKSKNINKQLLKEKIHHNYKKIRQIEKKKTIITNYIDPNVGTMLLSIVIALFSGIAFSIQMIYLKLKKLFNKDGDNLLKNSDIVIYSEGKQYWNVFEQILDEFENRKTKVFFYTSDKNDFVFNKNYQYVESKYIGNKNIAAAKLSMLRSNICIMTTPNLDIFHLKRSKNVRFYIHIIHSLGSLLTYKLYGLDYFDSVICANNYQKDEIIKLEEIRKSRRKEFFVGGCTYLDNLNNKKNSNNNCNKVITVAPSWGPNSLLNKYGFKLIDQLRMLNEEVIIRPHPQSLTSEKKIIENFIKYTENTNIKWDFGCDNTDILSKTDLLISDFSSIIFDYLFLYSKPFIYSLENFNKEMFDAGDFGEQPFVFKIFKELGIELTSDNFEKLDEIIKLSKNNFNSEKVQYYRNKIWENQNKAYIGIVDYILKKNQELINLQ